MTPRDRDRPVFFDQSGFRTHLFAASKWAAYSCLGALIACLCFTVMFTPILPHLKPVGSRKAPSTLNWSAASQASEPGLKSGTPRSASVAGAASVLRYGFLVNWDDNSFSALKRHAGELDVLVVEWLRFGGAGQSIAADAPERQLEIRKWLSEHAAGLKIIPLVNNYDPKSQGWDGQSVSDMLASAESRGVFIAAALKVVADGGYGGLAIDFAQFSAHNSRNFTSLVREATAAFHARSLTIHVVAAPNDPTYEHGALADVSDGLIVMMHDEHNETTKPGPLAGQGWFEQQLARIVGAVDRSKLIVGIGAYGQDWSATGKVHEISVQEAWEQLEETKTKLRFDPVSLNPAFAYRDDDGNEHHVWYLDAVTAFNQIGAALAQQPAGIALWRLGTEDPGIWSVFGRGRQPNREALADIEKMRSGYDVLFKGAGEVIAAGGTLADGDRALDYDAAANLIVNQVVVAYPRSTVVTRWGAHAEKVVALTFDDGPDAKYTPKILDILAAKGVKASFFIVGASGARNRDLLRRIYEAGHDIGNHTFSHANTALISTQQLTVELNATRRLLEATIGVGTELFRPPFAQDLEPRTIDAAQALITATSLGYVSIGMNIDPKDWLRPLAGQIVRQTVDQVLAGNGHVVLLHDGGGNRTPTIEALPVIIDTLREKGYRFVAIHELLGQSRDAVMPPVAMADQVMTMFNNIGFAAFHQFSTAVEFIFYAGLALGSIRLGTVAVCAVVHARRDRGQADRKWRPQSVAVIVPAFNESKVVCNTILALLRSRRKKFEVIVIDDGSKDGTADSVRATFGATARVRVIEKANGGKWSALNAGIASTSAEFVVSIDADTIFEPNAIELMLRHFVDPQVGAVAGSAFVGNRRNLITSFQSIEYVMSQNLDRRALDLVNGITVVPGAIGAWRRSALVDIGGYSADTLAEDADATIRLELAGWRVVYEPRAFAHTEAPETVRAFMKQRFRWMFGSLQVVFKHRKSMFDRSTPGLGFFGLPNILVFQFLFTLIAPVMDLMLVASLVSSGHTYMMCPEAGVPQSFITLASYWAYFQVIDILAALLAMSIDHKRGLWTSIPLLFLQRFTYRQLLYITALRVAAVALKGQMVGWGKLLRTGHVGQIART